jgi:hypothetical protein
MCVVGDRKMVEILWEDAVIKVCEDVKPNVSDASQWYVEVYESITEDVQGDPIIRMKVENEEAAIALREMLDYYNMDWEVFTSLSDL